jgi:succinyl-diaminopimelate desuccinylase
MLSIRGAATDDIPLTHAIAGEHAMREEILGWIDQDRSKIIDFMQGFVRAATPNPPGDTVVAMKHVRALLDREGVAYDIRERDATMPNLVASTAFSPDAKHLVLNGHIDVFPVENPGEWSIEPWDAKIRDGAIYGRGIADMKVGTTAALFTYLYLKRVQKPLKGKLTLTVVSDEETFGPNGARHLFETCADAITGTACLVGEPSSPHTIRFGEKGACWLRFTITTPGGHGAFAHLSPNAIDLAYPLLQDLRTFTSFEFQEPPAVVEALESAREAFEKANGPGAAKIARAITMNVGTMTAGPKVNMIASRCQFEVDFRLPNGVTKDDLIAHIERLRGRHAFAYEVLMSNDANWCEPESELAQIVRANAHKITGIAPVNVLALGNTDARLWRYRNIPAVVYGPTPRGMGSVDENVPVEEALNIVRCHVLSAFDYLKA